MVARPRSDNLLVAGHATATGRRPRALPVTLAKRGRAVVMRSTPRGAGSSGDLQAYGFAAHIYISFDSTQTALPAWLEITPWVDLARAPIRIGHGRTDGLSDIQPGTCSLTVKNNDLRFTPKNSLGPWAGLFGKDNWLRVDLTPPSGNTSTRYVGFLSSIIPAGDGLDAYTQLTASDRFGLMQSEPNFISAIGQEILTDAVYQVPSSQATLQAYYPLQEPAGSATLGDRSGNANTALTQQAVGSVPLGTGLSLANTAGPGVDAISTVTFNPPSATTGTVLTTTVPTPAAAGASVFALECWIKTTVGSGAPNNHSFMSLSDLTTNPYVFALIVDTTGYLGIGDTSPTPNGTPSDGGHYLVINNTLAGLLNPAPILNDGNWHHVFVWVRVIGGTNAGFLIAIDGVPIYGPPFIFPWAIPSTLSTLHIGGALSGITKGLVDPFNGSISDTAYYTLGVNFYGLPTHMPNFPQHAAAGLNGFYSESTDARIARLARYARVPQPITPTTIVAASTGFPVEVWSNQTATLGQWVDMQGGAHLCGTQQIAGAQPLSPLREAAQTENMPAYVSKSGNLAFRPNTSRWNLTAAWVVDAADIEAGTRFPDDKSYTFNQATVTPNGQASQTVNGPAGLASQAKTGVLLNKAVSTASVSTAEAIALGTDITNRQADPAPRPDQIVIIANTLARQTGYGNAWYDAVLASEISTPLQVNNWPNWRPDAATGVQLLEGYTEEIAQGTHTLTLSTSYMDPHVFTLDSTDALDSSVPIGY